MLLHVMSCDSEPKTSNTFTILVLFILLCGFLITTLVICTRYIIDHRKWLKLTQGIQTFKLGFTQPSCLLAYSILDNDFFLHCTYTTIANTTRLNKVTHYLLSTVTQECFVYISFSFLPDNTFLFFYLTFFLYAYSISSIIRER